MKTLWTALRISLILLVMCGLVYPFTVTGIGQLLFPKQANGSLVEFQGKPVGSSLLGQVFTDARFFHGRVSSVNYNTYTRKDTKPDQQGKAAYTGVSSGSSNLAPSNPELAKRVEKDLDLFLKDHPDVKKDQIPTDLLTSSGSGLDPEISPASAQVQISRVAKESGISVGELKSMVARSTEGRFWGIFGEPRVNVLRLNLAVAERLKTMGKL